MQAVKTILQLFTIASTSDYFLCKKVVTEVCSHCHVKAYINHLHFAQIGNGIRYKHTDTQTDRSGISLVSRISNIVFVFEKKKLFEKIIHEKNTKPKKLDDDHQRVEVKMPTAAAAAALLGYSSRSEGWIIRSFADIGR